MTWGELKNIAKQLDIPDSAEVVAGGCDLCANYCSVDKYLDGTIEFWLSVEDA